MYSLKLVGQIEFIKSSVFEGKNVNKLQFLNIGEKGVEIKEVKLSENQDIKVLKIGDNVEIDVKLFTSKTASDIYFSQNGEIKILKK